MSLKIRKTLKILAVASIVGAISLASFAGCTVKGPTEGMRDGNDINTIESSEEPETEPEATPTPTETPTPTPSPTPAKAHMDMPEEDTKAPMFLSLPESVSIKVGSEFNIQKHIGYIDNCDADVDIKVEGEVDTSTVGSYPITITLTDDAGNSKSGKMTVKVYKPSNSGGGSGGGGTDTHKTLAFGDFMARYPGSDTIRRQPHQLPYFRAFSAKNTATTKALATSVAVFIMLSLKKIAKTTPLVYTYTRNIINNIGSRI